MTRLCCALCVILMVYSINAVGNCAKSDDLLRTDLTQFANAALEDIDYQIVRFLHRNTGSEGEKKKELRFRRFGNDVTWRLRETSIIREKTPIWVVRNATTIEKVDENIIDAAVKFYQDETLETSVATALDAHNHTYFVGRIGDVNVAPLSNRTIRSILQERPHLAEEHTYTNESAEFDISNYHVLYRPKLQKSAPMEDQELFSKLRSKSHKPSYDRLRRSYEETVYPKMLAILDYNERYTTTHEVRFLKLIIYTINFWNTVNLRYSTLRDPIIKLRLTGIVVMNNRNEIPIIKKSIESGMLNVDLKWSLSLWLDSFIPATSYDMILMHTNLALCSKKKGPCQNGGLLGNAIIGFACNTPIRATGFIHDNRDYSGLHPAAHEIGHMLGLRHDTSKVSADCDSELGYIMAETVSDSEHRFEWSGCSKKALTERFSRPFGTCMDTDSPVPPQGNLVTPQLLPGRGITEYEQCQNRGYSKACQTEDVCQKLSCLRWYMWCVNTGPALDGTSCPGGECQNGRCVPKN